MVKLYHKKKVSRKYSKKKYSKKKYSRKKYSRKKYSRKKYSKKKGYKGKKIMVGGMDNEEEEGVEEEEEEEEEEAGDVADLRDQLRLAAELGQSLLQRTEDLQLANEQLAAEARFANEVVEETEYRVHELTCENARLHAFLEDKEAALEQKEEELRAALEEREKAEPSAEAASPTASSARPMAERTAQAEAELLTLRQQVDDLQERMAQAQHAWEQEGDERRKAERKHKKVAAELAATQEELRERSEAASSAQRTAACCSAAAQEERARVKDLTVQLASMKAEVARVNSSVGSGLHEGGKMMEQDEFEQKSALSADQIIVFIMDGKAGGCIDTTTGMDQGKLKTLVKYNFLGSGNEIFNPDEICENLKINLAAVMLKKMAEADKEDDFREDVTLLQHIVSHDGKIDNNNIDNILKILGLE